jgi:hypothetical protein
MLKNKVSMSPPVSKSIPFSSIKHENPNAPLKPFKASLSYKILSFRLFVVPIDEKTEALRLPTLTSQTLPHVRQKHKPFT